MSNPNWDFYASRIQGLKVYFLNARKKSDTHIAFLFFPKMWCFRIEFLRWPPCEQCVIQFLIWRPSPPPNSPHLRRYPASLRRWGEQFSNLKYFLWFRAWNEFHWKYKFANSVGFRMFVIVLISTVKPSNLSAIFVSLFTLIYTLSIPESTRTARLFPVRASASSGSSTR